MKRPRYSHGSKGKSDVMPDQPQIIQAGSLLLCWGALDETSFSRSRIWCEYYEPEELGTMQKWGGVGQAWLDEHVIARIEGTNGSVWYGPADARPVPPCEIMAVASRFTFGGREKHGFLTVVGGEITSGCIFMDGQRDLILSLADILDEHNHEELSRLAKEQDVPWEQLLPILYATCAENAFGIGVGTLDIPMSSTAPNRP